LLKSTDSCGKQLRRGNGRYRLCVWRTWGSAIGQIHDTTRGGRLCCAVLWCCGVGLASCAWRQFEGRGRGAGAGAGPRMRVEKDCSTAYMICWRCRLHKSCGSALGCFLPSLVIAENVRDEGSDGLTHSHGFVRWRWRWIGSDGLGRWIMTRVRQSALGRDVLMRLEH
jgi:hypothetical protein